MYRVLHFAITAWTTENTAIRKRPSPAEKRRSHHRVSPSACRRAYAGDSLGAFRHASNHSIRRQTTTDREGDARDDHPCSTQLEPGTCAAASQHTSERYEQESTSARCLPATSSIAAPRGSASNSVPPTPAQAAARPLARDRVGAYVNPAASKELRVVSSSPHLGSLERPVSLSKWALLRSAEHRTVAYLAGQFGK